jgi:hypothetical protein
MTFETLADTRHSAEHQTLRPQPAAIESP